MNGKKWVLLLISNFKRTKSLSKAHILREQETKQPTSSINQTFVMFCYIFAKRKKKHRATSQQSKRNLFSRRLLLVNYIRTALVLLQAF